MGSHLQKYIDYINNVNQRPLSTRIFDEDWEPAGPMVRKQMVEAGFIDEWDGVLVLTAKAEGAKHGGSDA